MKALKIAAALSVVCLMGCAQPYYYPEQYYYPSYGLPNYSAYYDTQMENKYWANIEDGYGMQGHMGVNRGVMYPTRYWDKEERIDPRW